MDMDQRLRAIERAYYDLNATVMVLANRVGRTEVDLSQTRANLSRIRSGTRAEIEQMKTAHRDIERRILGTALKTVWAIATGAGLIIFNVIWEASTK